MEGRNGQLSLRHHGLHRLTTSKLGALRVLHNFLIERPDATTATERFFGSRPEPLMPWLLTRLPMPKQPWQRRRFVTPSRPLAHAFLHPPPHPALSHRNLRGSAERYTGRTRSVPGERDSELSDVLKQPDDVYLGDELQSNPKSEI